MTGFVGWIAPDAAALDPVTMDALCMPLAAIGPDRQDRWHSGRAFLAHALFATTREEAGDRQPLTFDGSTWILGDLRLDGRDELIAALRQAGRQSGAGVPDSALALHAWHAWGEACADRLIGDYAFAIWDANAQTLLLARDPFGSVPLHVVEVDGGILFGNSVRALLAHPGIDHALDPLGIGDYLLWGYRRDPARGMYRDIAMLPPAHCRVYGPGGVRTRRTWSPAAADPRPLSPRAMADRVVAFRELMQTAVDDRLRLSRVATTLSGGMDSTLVTALAARAPDCRVDAYSFGSDFLLPDTERHLAWRCARHLGVPFHSVSNDDCFFDPPGGPWRIPAEPRMELRYNSYHRLWERLEADGHRVLLMGMGGDVITSSGLHLWGALASAGRVDRLAAEAWRYWRHFGRRPPLRGAWRARRPPSPTPFPSLIPLDPEFERAHRLRERWAQVDVPQRDFRLGMAQEQFWTEMFVACHPAASGVPLRVRQPFFDVRLVDAAAALPAAPWQFGKTFLRAVGEGLLPAETLTRPKTAFRSNVAWEAARMGLEPWLADAAAAPELDGIVDRRRMAEWAREPGRLAPFAYGDAVLRPAGLAQWLRQRHG